MQPYGVAYAHELKHLSIAALTPAINAGLPINRAISSGCSPTAAITASCWSLDTFAIFAITPRKSIGEAGGVEVTATVLGVETVELNPTTGGGGGGGGLKTGA